MLLYNIINHEYIIAFTDNTDIGNAMKYNGNDWAGYCIKKILDKREK